MISSRSFITVTVTTLAGLAAAYLSGLPLAAGFAAGPLLLVILLIKGGLPRREAAAVAWRGALHTREVVLILLFVSLLIPTWSASGTIDAMIGAGMKWFSPALFLTSSFLLSGAIAYLLGTSTGTLSAVGLPVIGMAAQLDIPLAMAAGALVSGAFVGDRGSPISSAFRLTADSAGISPRELGRAIAPTTLLGLAATIAFFFAADQLGGWGEEAAGAGGGAAAGEAMAPAIPAMPAAGGDLWLYVPPALLVGAMLLRLGTRLAFILAITSGIAVGILHAGIPLADWPSMLWNGWSGASGRTAGGLRHMLDLVLLIALAGAFNGLVERSGAIEPIVRRIFASARTLGRSTWRAGLFGLALDLVSCTQTLPIMMSTRMLRQTWIQRFGRSAAAHLGRVAADTALLFAALVPWNMLAILCGTILGVPVIDYVPFAVYVWSIPLFTLAWSAWAGRRLKPERAFPETRD